MFVLKKKKEINNKEKIVIHDGKVHEAIVGLPVHTLIGESKEVERKMQVQEWKCLKDKQVPTPMG